MIRTLCCRFCVALAFFVWNGSLPNWKRDLQFDDRAEDKNCRQ